ncbi:MAG: RHS repeat-associated core domain-containing protein [Desulfococcaceae bacterium]
MNCLSVYNIHDPLGRRIAKKVSGIITEKYLWSGLTTLLAVYDGSDNLLMRFEYADARLPFAMTMGGVLYYLAYDQVGTLKLVAGSAGNVVKRLEYDTFGNIINDTNPGFAVPFSFAGGLHDRHTGLVRFGYRDYDPDTGRWTAKDPIGFAGGDTDLYGYCVNNPVNLIDPTGEFALAGALLGGGIDLAVQLISGDDINWVSVGMSALAGAAGVGLGTSVAKLTTSFAKRMALNAIGSAAIGAATKYGQNLIEGNPCHGDGVLESAILGGVLGGAGFAAGSLAESFITSTIWNNLSLGQKLLANSNAVSVPGGISSLGVGIGNIIGNTIANSGPIANNTF